MQFLRRCFRRIRPRFGIRFLLVLVTIAAVLAATIGAWYQRAEEQRRVIAELSDLGASIQYEVGFMERHGPNMVGGIPPTNWREKLDDWLSDKFGKDAAYKVRRVYVSGGNAVEALMLVPKLRGLEELAVRANEDDRWQDAWSALLRCNQIESLKLRRHAHQANRLTGLARLSNLKHLTIDSGDLTIDDVREIANMPRLETLNLLFPHTSDAALKPLGKLTQLNEFHLKHAGKSTTVTTDGVAFIASMPRLRRLTLARMPLINDDIFEHIATLKELTELDLDQAGVRGIGFDRLQELPKLTTLNLIGTESDDASLQHLSKLGQLKSLNLAYTKVTDAGTMHLANLTNLTKLKLSGIPITDESMSHLSGLNLQELFFASTQVSDAGIEHLLEIGTLRQIGYAKSRVTLKGKNRIKKMLPNCQIW